MGWASVMQLRRLLSSSLNSAVGVTGRTSRKCYLACGNSCAISSVTLKGAFQSLPNKTKTPDDVIKINAALAVWRRAVTTQGRSNETHIELHYEKFTIQKIRKSCCIIFDHFFFLNLFRRFIISCVFISVASQQCYLCIQMQKHSNIGPNPHVLV